MKDNCTPYRVKDLIKSPHESKHSPMIHTPAKIVIATITISKTCKPVTKSNILLSL